MNTVIKLTHPNFSPSYLRSYNKNTKTKNIKQAKIFSASQAVEIIDNVATYNNGYTITIESL